MAHVLLDPQMGIEVPVHMASLGKGSVATLERTFKRLLLGVAAQVLEKFLYILHGDSALDARLWLVDMLAFIQLE
jgi:hypothetical protein